MQREHQSLAEIAKVFFRLGCIGFGGPAVHISMMNDEVVEKRKWLSKQHFIDLVGATNLIPGPNSTEMAMHCGHERAGLIGLIVAGVCFIAPAATITGVVAMLYKAYGTLPNVQPFIYGIKPAVIAIVVAAMISLGKKAISSVTIGFVAVIAFILVLIGANELVVILGSGLVGILIGTIQKTSSNTLNLLAMILPEASTSTGDLGATKMFWMFLKIGSILYGSGYVLYAFIDADFVRTGLMSHTMLIDAIAVGQFTPGPVLSSATFIGYQLQGFPGALAATVGIFLPSFLFVAFLNPLIPRLRRSVVMSSFLSYINASAIAIIMAVCIHMSRTSIFDWKTSLIAVVSLSIVFRFRKLNSAFIIIGSSMLGFLLTLLSP